MLEVFDKAGNTKQLVEKSDVSGSELLVVTMNVVGNGNSTESITYPSGWNNESVIFLNAYWKASAADPWRACNCKSDYGWAIMFAPKFDSGNIQVYLDWEEYFNQSGGYGSRVWFKSYFMKLPENVINQDI